MTQEELRAEHARLLQEHEQLLDRISRSNRKLAPHLANRAYRAYSKQSDEILAKMAAISEQLTDSAE